ncbi:hypothetical protein A3A79_02920 [Candidatus Gottesmanbacteria bacterium RIFCSPLOWO2_01_FULL_43_11b]|uniref:Double zinc ribbon domain-containing protein n=1 Tax=Candidatus Gottesmanbacteria bacterium RIFCSPLOWO2_01_FULL_43_11b TaxID=1798392 RepID=A0A1F6AI90_9BACT|nr:MAG: hypothetical protein A3A79_02920 [Candidatus Gottesmanbacteria bacterium RIFCSPLOWO2_01_FULL_43_11b]
MEFLDILFPKRCLRCGRIGKYFCPSCRTTIASINTPMYPIGLNGLTCFFRYQGIIQKAIKALKYRSISDLASEFVSLIPQVEIPNVDVFIPVPLHASRYRQRGFNQAEVLGRLIAEKLHIPIRTDILRRIKRTTPQVEMKKRKERLKNMEKVFAATYSPERVLLFDDVFTTGATIRSAANVLKRAGAKFIWGMTMAR